MASNNIEVEIVPNPNEIDVSITVQDNTSSVSLVQSKGDKGDTGATGVGVISGGTTGQVLGKNSDTDYDMAWINSDATNQINAHNVSSTAHSDIRTLIDTKIAAIPAPDVSGQISTHNSSTSAHSDIRTLISNEATRAENAESSLQSALNSEISRAQTAEGSKANQSTTYTKDEVDSKIAAIPTPDVSGQINTHNTDTSAHSDIRGLISSETTRAQGVEVLKANQADLSAEISRAQAAEALKVDKVDGKGLSTNDFTNALLTLLNQQSGTNSGDETQSSIITKLGTSLSNKYDSGNFVAGTNYLTPNGSGVSLTNLRRKNSNLMGQTYLNIPNVANQSLSAGVDTKLDLSHGAITDYLSEFSTSDYKFRPSYNQNAQIVVNIPFAQTNSHTFSIYKDGSAYILWQIYGNSIIFTTWLYFVTTSYYEFYIKSAVNDTVYSSYEKIKLTTYTGA